MEVISSQEKARELEEGEIIEIQKALVLSKRIQPLDEDGAGGLALWLGDNRATQLFIRDNIKETNESRKSARGLRGYDSEKHSRSRTSN